MSSWTLPRTVALHHGPSPDRPGACAVTEIRRLLAPLATVTAAADGPAAAIVIGTAGVPALGDVRHDGYALAVEPTGVALAAPTGKGLLNAVYDLAERLGYVFALPGEAGEFVPPRPRPLPVGATVRNPRFAWRGPFWQALGGLRYTREEWLRFYAKLRFNTLGSEDMGDLTLCRELGLRMEVGGHHLSKLVSREHFDEDPELYRMFQPVDFGGRRQADYNFCISNPHTRAAIRATYARRLAEHAGAYALHDWADDLPGGGWCLCPNCRSLSNADQSIFATRLLGQIAEETGSDLRVPVLAYHDTLFPGRTVRPHRRNFLFFAPRERCYGHRLDDPDCARNRVFLEALEAWLAATGDLADPHVLEYYWDQILFRGMYPYIPEVILGDLACHQRLGISTVMPLQVGGPAVAPEWNMLLFARAVWDAKLTSGAFAADVGARLLPDSPAPVATYLASRAAACQSALEMCGYDPYVYLDYRWLPENDEAFGRERPAAYRAAADGLQGAANILAAAIHTSWPAAIRELLSADVARARFEAAELRVMAPQQAAANALGRSFNTDAAADRQAAMAALDQARAALPAARAAAERAGIPAAAWYYRNINAWLDRELDWKRRAIAGEKGRPAR